jgi:hypothetical protein
MEIEDRRSKVEEVAGRWRRHGRDRRPTGGVYIYVCVCGVVCTFGYVCGGFQSSSFLFSDFDLFSFLATHEKRKYINHLLELELEPAVDQKI